MAIPITISGLGLGLGLGGQEQDHDNDSDHDATPHYPPNPNGAGRRLGVGVSIWVESRVRVRQPHCDNHNRRAAVDRPGARAAPGVVLGRRSARPANAPHAYDPESASRAPRRTALLFYARLVDQHHTAAPAIPHPSRSSLGGRREAGVRAHLAYRESRAFWRGAIDRLPLTTARRDASTLPNSPEQAEAPPPLAFVEVCARADVSLRLPRVARAFVRAAHSSQTQSTPELRSSVRSRKQGGPQLACPHPVANCTTLCLIPFLVENTARASY
ncbi:hypothetical protein FB451DRAFT_1377301 [Mycena latifolia]|nr:hypothetical protein FB451DRAFT_1377301 [Mycena latifolia]